MMDNEQIKWVVVEDADAQGDIFEQGNPFSEGIETLNQVAEALNLTAEYIRTHARHAPKWDGQLFRRDTKKDVLIKDDDFFFPAGTIERNKDNFGRRKKRPPHFTESLMQTIDELKDEINKLKRQQKIPIDAIQNRVETGGLLPAEGEEGPGF